MEQLLPLIISLISGAVGGNIAGAAMPEKNLGAIGNTIVGLLGGGVGGFILKALGVLGAAGVASADPSAAAPQSFDFASLLANIGVSGVSGGALTAIVALIKDAVARNK